MYMEIFAISVYDLWVCVYDLWTGVKLAKTTADGVLLVDLFHDLNFCDI